MMATAGQITPVTNTHWFGAQNMERTIFHRPRSFTLDAFNEFIFSLSQPDTATLQLAAELTRFPKPPST
jgi:hypothetical protein